MTARDSTPKRSCPTLRRVPFPRPFRGFPWWLPLATAAIAALLTALIVGSAQAVWAAESRVWIRDGQLALKDVTSIFMDPMVLETALQWSQSDLSPAELADAAQLTGDQRLFIIRVSAHSPGEAEELADLLAAVVVEECRLRNPGPSRAEALGTSWPGARRIAPPRRGRPPSAAGPRPRRGRAAGPRACRPFRFRCRRLPARRRRGRPPMPLRPCAAGRV